ncbi:MAG: LysR family transcriptional regulator [Actinobacteria bacterium]|nr:LysR family transcriptional regulator [Actinomycetota bacterium]
MNIRQLEYLDALARERSFRRAAAECNASQPAVSVAIAKLEGELGVELVHRHRREAVLTAPGEALVGWAREALSAVRSLTAEAGRLAGTLNGRLRLGVIPTALPGVAGITKGLLAAHPGVRLEVRSLPSDAIVAELLSFRIDAGLTYLDNEPIGAVTAIPAYVERYLYLTAERVSGERIDWADLDGGRLCLLTPDMQNRRIVDGALEGSGATVAAVVETDSISALISYVRAGWPSIVSDTWVGLYGVPDGMSAVPLGAPAISHSVGFVTRETDVPQPLVKALVESLGSGEEAGGRAAGVRSSPSSL